MSTNKKIVIINNEKISNSEKSFFCDNIDMKSIPEGLDKFFFTTLIARKSNIKVVTKYYQAILATFLTLLFS